MKRRNFLKQSVGAVGILVGRTGKRIRRHRVTWKQLADMIESVDQPLRVGLDYVTTYRGKPIAADKKSVTLTVTYRSPDSTLRSEQVDDEIAALVAAAKDVFAADLRV